MKASEVPSIARRQRGVFTVRQALAAGWTMHQINRRLRTRAWVRVAGAGVVAAGTTRTAQVAAWAVHLTWVHAVVSHATAAGLHGFPVRGDLAAHASLPRKSGRSATITTWASTVEPSELWVVDGVVRLTSPKLTAIDCLATLPRDRAAGLLAWVMTRGIVTRGDLELGLERYRRRPGAAQLRTSSS